MKILPFIACIILVVSSCNYKKENTALTPKEIASIKDSFATALTVDSMVKSSISNHFLEDTSKLHDAPIIVLKAVPVKKEYSNYKDIRLTWKNVSNKTISAVRFRWYGVNAFNEAAEMGGSYRGIGGGFSDDKLKPGRTDYGEWSLLSSDLKKVVKAWPYEVAFEDGTKWEIKND